jgi:hypothetical protein
MVALEATKGLSIDFKTRMDSTNFLSMCMKEIIKNYMRKYY